MAWVSDDQQRKEKKPTWEYKDGVEFITFIPDTSRQVAILTGEMDPTKTWTSPIAAWVHEFKVATGFATIICNKWNEACPYCYENELYKKANPNYKNVNGRLPYGLSKKALVQVWDFQEKKVLWMLAGKHIQEGMDFILSKQMNQYKGFVMVTRMGDRLNTTYRVDLAQGQLDAFAIQTIQNTIVPLANVDRLMHMTRDDLIKKTGIDPIQYFKTKLPLNLGVDISNWGPVPQEEYASIPEVSKPSEPQQGGSGVPSVQSGGPSTVDPVIEAALNAVCTVGVYKGAKMVDIILQTGRTYIQYLARTDGCTQPEKDASAVILGRWNEVELAVKKMEVAF